MVLGRYRAQAEGATDTRVLAPARSVRPAARSPGALWRRSERPWPAGLVAACHARVHRRLLRRARVLVALRALHVLQVEVQVLRPVPRVR